MTNSEILSQMLAEGKSESKRRTLRIQYWLEVFTERNLLKDWTRDSARWVVQGIDGLSPRYYTTLEIEAFIDGMRSAMLAR